MNAVVRMNQKVGTVSSEADAIALLNGKVWGGCRAVSLRTFYVFGSGLSDRGSAGQDTIQAWVHAA